MASINESATSTAACHPNLSENIRMIPLKALEKIEEHLKKGLDCTEDDVKCILAPKDLKHSDILVPIDVRGFSDEMQELDGPDSMLKSLGSKAIIQDILKAREYHKGNIAKELPDMRASALSFKAWNDLIEEDSIASGDDNDDSIAAIQSMTNVLRNLHKVLEKEPSENGEEDAIQEEHEKEMERKHAADEEQASKMESRQAMKRPASKVAEDAAPVVMKRPAGKMPKIQKV